MDYHDKHPLYIYRDLVPIPDIEWDDDDIDINDSYALERLMLKRMVD